MNKTIISGLPIPPNSVTNTLLGHNVNDILYLMLEVSGLSKISALLDSN